MLDARRVKFRSKIVQASIKRDTDAGSAFLYGAEDDVSSATWLSAELRSVKRTSELTGGTRLLISYCPV